MIEIHLTRGYITIVDDCDSDLSNSKWYSQITKNGNIYAVRNVPIGNGKHTGESMHRVILSKVLGRKLSKLEEVDHIDMNGLNNQRANLRLATSAQNKHNRKAYKNNKSGFKGASPHKGTGKWQATISIEGKQKFLGYFDTPEDAHAAYCNATKKYHGEFARTE